MFQFIQRHMSASHGAARVSERTNRMVAQNLEPLVLTIQDAVTYSRLSRTRLYMLIASGMLPSFTVGGRRLIYRAAVDAFFASLTSPTADNEG
jgi:excisionase family DNA binding protein